MKVFNSFTGQMVEASVFGAATRLIELSKTKNPWDVVDEIIKIWIKKKPNQWKAHLVKIEDLKKTRKNQFASTKDKSLRYILDIPEQIIMMIRILYSTEEMPMDKKWMLKFARRYPRFVVAEKV